MTEMSQDYYKEFGEEESESLTFEPEDSSHYADDFTTQVGMLKQIEQMIEVITRIGGEVCKLRGEMDNVLEQNSLLIESYQRLRDVLSEKGFLDMDDFQLACDVFEESNTKPLGSLFHKKLSH